MNEFEKSINNLGGKWLINGGEKLNQNDREKYINFRFFLDDIFDAIRRIRIKNQFFDV